MMKKHFMEFVRHVGWLRLVLYVLALSVVILRPAPGTPGDYHGFALARTVLVPTLTPLVFMGLLLDVMMSLVLRSDADGAARLRYRTAIISDLSVALLVVVVWIPYFRALGQ